MVGKVAAGRKGRHRAAAGHRDRHTAAAGRRDHHTAAADRREVRTEGEARNRVAEAESKASPPPRPEGPAAKARRWLVVLE